ncbi:chemotaxis protein CheA [Actomonas aquatica]|uniref:Chemotaxis protein CheA n=1 Tax=Actomonas aquatica TaxID=2866162 RepID=A0ABZ1CC87_9BACT|nr:chemotaxis protein CheA [Opitutus sp. WL0086]WRQ89294.1 chemotaxis protein CheA [Opitutus sp. WL0086]
MPISQENLTAIDEISNRLASESILIQVGKDDGLIPIYSLLGELIELAGDDSAFLAPALEVRSGLDALLDNAMPFDEANVSKVKRLIDWLPMAVLTRRAEDDLPTWDEDVLEVRDGGVESAAAPVAEEPVPAAATAAAEPEVDTSIDTVLDLNMEENAELLAEFHAEAVDHLQQIEAALLVLDEEPKDADAMASMFRSFHTIKGVSGFLKLTPMHTLTHEVESLLDLARNNELDLTPSIITEILRSRDAVQAMVQQITVALEQGVLPDEVIPVSNLIASVKRVAVPRGTEPAPVAAAAPAAPAPISFADAAAELEAEQEEAAAPVAAKSDAPAAKAAPRRANVVRPMAATATVRVNTEKLDNLMNVVGELVIVQSQLMESSRDRAADSTDDGSTLTRNLTQLGRITKELQHTAMALRMVPVKPTFQKMERIARDLSRECGKKVSFHVSGEDTEIDRSVVEEIADPLVHMVRNAMDHGLEDPEGRTAAGKDVTGNVSLNAYHQGSNMVIELTDDGRGLDANKLLAKARKQGLIGENHGLEEQEIYQLIFHPGFSTAEKVTAVSGRGVGMDVVKRNIEKLRGKIEIESELGIGSTFRIMLPLTMAIIDGLVVKVGEDRFILPSTSVQMALRPSPEILSKVQGTGEVLDHRGKILPITRLHQQFGIPGAIEQPTEGIMVIVESAGRSHALLVDEMVNKQEVVIKSLGSFLQGLRGVAGGAILGDGNIALILDPGALFDEAA